MKSCFLFLVLSFLQSSAFRHRIDYNANSPPVEEFQAVFTYYNTGTIAVTLDKVPHNTTHTLALYSIDVYRLFSQNREELDLCSLSSIVRLELGATPSGIN